MTEGTVQSVERTFSLLEQLAAHPRGLGLVELSDMVQLHKSTAHRLLSCMIGLGYVVKDSGTGHYRLTFRMLELSNGMLGDLDVLSAAKPHLDALADATGETVHLVIPDGLQGVYVYKSEPSHTTGAQMRSRVGLRIPLIHTAAGKAILALATQEQVQQLWQESDTGAVTVHTITDYSAFLAELAQVRGAGWAMDNEENELGVRCIGAAIPDLQGRGMAAMSLSANAAKMTPQHVAELVPQLLRCREDICRDMGTAL